MKIDGKTEECVRKGQKMTSKQRRRLSRALSRSSRRKTPRRRGAVMERFVQDFGQAFKADNSIKLTDKITNLAKLFDVSRDYVRLLLPRAGCEISRPSGAGNRTGVSGDQILKAVKEDEAKNGKSGSSQRIAKRFGLSSTYVNQVRRRAGFPAGRQKRPYDKEKAKRLYVSQHQPLYKIRRQLKIGETRLKRDLLAMGVTIRSNTAHFKDWHAERSALVGQGKILATIESMDPRERVIALAIWLAPPDQPNEVTQQIVLTFTKQAVSIKTLNRVRDRIGKKRKKGAQPRKAQIANDRHHALFFIF